MEPTVGLLHTGRKSCAQQGLAGYSPIVVSEDGRARGELECPFQPHSSALPACLVSPRAVVTDCPVSSAGEKHLGRVLPQVVLLGPGGSCVGSASPCWAPPGMAPEAAQPLPSRAPTSEVVFGARPLSGTACSTPGSFLSQRIQPLLERGLDVFPVSQEPPATPRASSTKGYAL